MKDKILEYIREAGGTFYDFSEEKYLYYYDDYLGAGRTFVPMPTYREIALKMGIKQREVRRCIEQLEREGKAVKPKWSWQRRMGTLLFHDDEGKERLLEAYGGENCCFVLLEVRSRFDYDIVEMFDSKQRFDNSFDEWLVDGYGAGAKPWCINYKRLYGRDDWLKWTLNVHDSAWPGCVVARALDKVVYKVETYSREI